MDKVLLLSPKYGNGGIASWTKKFVVTFPNDEFQLTHIWVSDKAKNLSASFFKRAWSGLLEIPRTLYRLHKANKTTKHQLFHMTTSGSLGTFRDYFIGLWCMQNKIPSIMHCRYGCIPKIIDKNNFESKFLIHVMSLFTQIWVLDKKTFDKLHSIDKLKNKIRLTPNSIIVNNDCDLTPKSYKDFAFIANVLPTKGIIELIEGFVDSNIDGILHIIGPANEAIKTEMKNKSKDLWNNKIIYHGKLSNTEAVSFMERIDCLILPTYYEGEAFPISILEGMSLGKLIVSTPRAAIPDMLKMENGEYCGILIEERSSNEITKALNWIVSHKEESDKLCEKAYNKVRNYYSTENVYRLYRKYYRETINAN